MHDMGPFVYLHRVSLFGRCYRGPSDGGSLLRDAHSWRGHGDQTIGDTAIDHREKTDQIERDSSRLKKRSHTQSVKPRTAIKIDCPVRIEPGLINLPIFVNLLQLPLEGNFSILEISIWKTWGNLVMSENCSAYW